MFNTNPTCKQFTAALKTSVLNGLTAPITGGNVEADYCQSISNLSTLISQSPKDNFNLNNDLDDCDLEEEKGFDFNKIDNNFGTAYTAGYLISKITVPECSKCNDQIFASEIEKEHLFVQFKEYDNKSRLKYANQNLINMSDQIFKLVESFLDTHGHEYHLEDKIKLTYKSIFQSFIFCLDHKEIYDQLINKCLRLSIFKYCKDKKNSISAFSKGHYQKMIKFKKQKLGQTVTTNTLPLSTLPSTSKDIT